MSQPKHKEKPPAPPAPRCRMCGQPLRRIGQGFGHYGQGLFCSADCGYSYAVSSIEEEARGAGVPMTAAEVAEMRAAREDREDARAAARTQAAATERTSARLARERAAGAARTAEMLARTKR